MKECLMAILDCPYWNLVNFFLAIFAAAISVGYLLKPGLIYAIFQRTKDQKTKWVVEVRNKNTLPFKIKEIKCEIAVSENIQFTAAKSLELLKSETLFLERDNKKENLNYIFVPAKETCEFVGYTFIRARLLATNILGVKKHYERIYKIECLHDQDCIILMGNCSHKRLTKKLISDVRNNQNNHA